MNNLSNESRVMLFTHNDLDGIGCEIVGKLAFDNIEVKNTRNPQDASNEVEAFINAGRHKSFDAIFITDISITEQVADMVDDLDANEMLKFYLLDHHKTAEDLNKRVWAEVEVNGVIGLNSGTNMFYEYLRHEGFFKTEIYRDAIQVFVEKVRRYDCWEWKTRYDDLEAGALNQLFWLLGRNVFTSKMVRKFKTNGFFSVSEGSWLEMLDSIDRAILDIDNHKKELYVKMKERQMKTIEFLGNQVGVVFAEQYISELGNELSERNPHLKYIMLIDMGGNKVSLRTIHDDINLGTEVAKRFGGGGHAKASGFVFDESLVKHSVNLITEVGIVSKLRKFVDKFSK
ncbi:DHH family phosphoesterase [Priestia aryabhattai]|uniref:DHH family phosphoesterase n=1 Tax=Priestia megaterium TaxID=1404 RepID=UPI003F9481AE